MDKDNLDNTFVDNTKYQKVDLKEEMSKSFIAYAMAVNVSRAIPDVRDGLKPVHRRILYTMNEMGLTYDKPTRKCAGIVGEVLGKYHPHGDVAVYDALVRLAQDFSINEMLVYGQGNFGSVDGDPPAAMRYTEAKLSKIAGEMLRDIDKNTVDFYPNYDGRLQQPTVLPSRFPNLLVNGSDGIAVGMATNIPPHNLGEVIDGVVALIDNPNIEIDDLIKIIPAPDFPTRGILLGRQGAIDAYKTGRGSIVLRGRAEIEQDDKKTTIVITEIPYQVNKENLIKQIADLARTKKINGISDIHEESDREGMRIVIDIKRDANAQVVLNLLYKHTLLQTSIGIIMLALVDGEPKILNLKEILSCYLKHQKEVVKRRTAYLLEKARDRAHILEGLAIALKDVDNVVKIIKSSKDKDEAQVRLKSKYNLSDKQANAILEMRLQRLTSLEVQKVLDELKLLHSEIEDYTGILASEKRVLDIVKTEILEIKDKYAKKRKTEIALDYNALNIEDFIVKEDVIISLTHTGYVKRQPLAEYREQKRGGVGVYGHKTKEDDFVIKMFVASSLDTLLFFTNKGKVYEEKAYMLPEAQKNTKGRAMINFLKLGEGELVSEIIRLEGNSGSLVMATKNGLIKKTDVKEYLNVHKNGKIALRLVKDDELISVELVKKNDKIIVGTHDGKCIKFNEKDLRNLGRNSQGVRSIRLGKGDFVVDMSVLKPGNGILTISENGYGKITDPKDYRLQIRGGKGIKAGIFNEKTGHLINLKQVTLDKDVMIMTEGGNIIRMQAKEISKMGRNTQGVKIIRLRDKMKVACFSVVDHEESKEKVNDIDDGVVMDKGDKDTKD